MVMTRKRAQRNRDEANDDDEVQLVQVYAPGTAPPPPAKRRRRPLRNGDHREEKTEEDDEETKQEEPDAEDDTLEPELRRQRQLDARQFLEVGYMGVTRAVVGLGFHVRELLFGDEFVSMRISNWTGGDVSILRGLVESCAEAMGLGDAYESVIDHVDVDVETAPDAVTLHLVNKHVAQLLLENLASSSDLLKDIVTQPVRSITTKCQAEVLGDMAITGRIYVTWADAASSGGGKIYFGSAAAANAFLLCWNSHQSWYSKLKLAVLGFTPDDYDAHGQRIQGPAAAAERLHRLNQNFTTNPKLPPLRRDYVYQDKKIYCTYFDEAEIAEMPVTQAENLEYCVSIPTELPVNMDEKEMMDLLKPHKAEKCVVIRAAITHPARAPQLAKRQAVQPLFTFITGEYYYQWSDPVAKRSGLYAEFTDVERMELVHDDAMRSIQWNTMEVPNGHPVRQEMEYRMCIRLATEVYACFRTRIAKVFIGARNNDVRCTATLNADDTNVTDLHFYATAEDPLQRVAKALKETIECDKINDEDTTNVLFSHTGRVKVQELAAQFNGKAAVNAQSALFVRLIDSDKSIWVYGEKACRQEAVQALIQLSRKIQRDVQVLDRVVALDMKKFGRTSVKKWLNGQAVVKRLYHCDVLGGGSHVILSGSKTEVHAVLTSWVPSGVLRKEHALALANERPSQTQHRPKCGVCTTIADPPVMKFALCGHTFCLECIQPGLTSSSRLPLECPAENCGCYIHAKDIVKITNDASALVEMAAIDYVAKHPEECVVCPKAGCNQILSCANAEPARQNASGQFIACESCAKNYCLCCSKSTGKAVEGHDDVRCSEFLAAGGAVVDGYIRFIRDRIFTLSCPQCQAAFLDFDGCTSVQCGNAMCRRYFCANCLVFSALDSKSTHDHVLVCAKNPWRGNYYVSTQALAKMHRDQRTRQLREYLVSHVTSIEARRIILKRLAKDLADLGIAAPTDLLANGANAQQQQGVARRINAHLRSLLH